MTAGDSGKTKRLQIVARSGVSTTISDDKPGPAGCLGYCGQGESGCPTPGLCGGVDDVDIVDIVERLLWPVAAVALCWAGVTLWRAWPWLP